MSLKLRKCSGESCAAKMLSFLFAGGKTEVPSGNITLLGLAMQEGLT